MFRISRKFTGYLSVSLFYLEVVRRILHGRWQSCQVYRYLQFPACTHQQLHVQDLMEGIGYYY